MGKPLLPRAYLAPAATLLCLSLLAGCAHGPAPTAEPVPVAVSTASAPKPQGRLSGLGRWKPKLKARSGRRKGRPSTAAPAPLSAEELDTWFGDCRMLAKELAFKVHVENPQDTPVWVRTAGSSLLVDSYDFVDDSGGESMGGTGASHPRLEALNKGEGREVDLSFDKPTKGGGRGSVSFVASRDGRTSSEVQACFRLRLQGSACLVELTSCPKPLRSLS